MLQRATHRSLLAAAVGFALASLFVPVTTGPEYALFDLRMALISSLRPAPAEGVGTAVILMDQASEDAMGVPQGPEWRQFHGDVIETLTRAGARVIAFDAEFAGSTPWDTVLAASFLRAGNIVAGEITPGSTTPGLEGALADIGSLTYGMARERPRWVEPKTGERAPFSVVIAARVGVLEPPTGRVWIDFRTPIDAIPVFSYVSVLNAGVDRLADDGRTPLSIFSGRIVLIGKDLPFEGDRFAFPNTLGTVYPGVLGQAYAVQTILSGSGLSERSPLVDLLFNLVVSLLAGAATLMRHRALRLPALTVVPAGAFLLSVGLLAGPGLWLGITGPLLATVAVLVTHWITRRLWLVSQLGRALGFRPDLIEAFRAAGRKSGGTVQRPATVVCSDVRSFTRFVRDTPPEAVARVMGRYVSAMEAVVTRCGGYVNKYVGDEIVAIFGFPLNEVACERRAIEAALQMQEQLERLQSEWAAAGDPGLQAIGIGVDTGTLTFAEVGGTAKVQFDIFGDAVNGASRLQSLTKETGRSLLVSAECFRGVEAASVAARFETLGFLSLRGQGERQVLALRRDPEGTSPS